MTRPERIALFTDMSFAPRCAPVLVQSLALRRVGMVIKRTRYVGVVVDERVLTQGFVPIRRPGRMQALLLLRGSISFGGAAPLDAGEALLLHSHQQASLRLENAEYLELDWDTDDEVAGPTPLGIRVDPTALFAAFDRTPEPLHHETFALAVDTFRRAGVRVADLPADLAQLTPSERDMRLAQALSSQVQNISLTDTLTLGELAGLSPRQLQRVFAEFCERYGIYLSGWRDTRNRWRVQLAAVLLSLPDLTHATIAEEVGYGSTPALGRAFARAGLPSPAELRRRLLDPARDGSLSDMRG